MYVIGIEQSHVVVWAVVTSHDGKGTNRGGEPDAQAEQQKMGDTTSANADKV